MYPIITIFDLKCLRIHGPQYDYVNVYDVMNYECHYIRGLPMI